MNHFFSPINHSYAFRPQDLIHTTQRLNAILDRHGFTNYKLFRRLFHEKFGCTPGELRKKNAASGITAGGREHIQSQMFDMQYNNDQRKVRGL